MGCIYSSCFPSRHPSEPDEARMPGIIRDELGRWKMSLAFLEKENGKEARLDANRVEGNSSKDVAVSLGHSHNSPQHTKLPTSYRDLKNLFLQNNKDKPVARSNSADRGSSNANRLQNGAVELAACNLTSMTSGELMLSVDPAVLRRKLLNPPHERLRQETVDVLKVVHTSQNDPHYKTLTSLAADIFKVPTAAIGIIDEARVWMKAIHGKGLASEIPRETYFASYMLLHDKREVMVVEDVREDGRFHDMMDKIKSRKRIRFFAAAPLIASNGYQIGALTISDTKPRKLDAGSFTFLTNLAEMIMRAVEKEAFKDLADSKNLPPAFLSSEAAEESNIKINSSDLDLSLIRDLSENRLQKPNSMRRNSTEKLPLLRSSNMLETGIMVCNAACSKGASILYVNTIWAQLTGISADIACQKTLWELFCIQGQEVKDVELELKEAFEKQRTVKLTAKLNGPACKDNYLLSIKCSPGENLDSDTPLVGVPNFVEFSQQRSLVYFFVLVRKNKDLPAHRLPTSAFAAVASDEAWKSGEDDGMEEVEIEEPRPLSSLERRTSVSVPYNNTIFLEVALGPLLGRGSYGKVHRGVWNDKQIAVKIIEVYHKGEPADEIDDLPEASLMEEVRHPNVMVTYEHATRIKYPANSSFKADFNNLSDAQNGYILETWLLLEYCNKGCLQDATDRGWFRTEPSLAKGKPELGIILPTALELAEGLAYLHARGLLHGDLSAGNILLSNHPEAPHGFTVKIADFGLSRPTESKTIKTQTFGTVTHMPPELLMEGRLSKAADVYAFGVVLWGMFTGVPPWQGLRRTQIMFKVTALGASLKIPPNCPPFYQSLLERCMNRDDKQRPTFEQLVEELRGLVEEQRSSLQPPEPKAPLQGPRSRRSMSYKLPLSEVAEDEVMRESGDSKLALNNTSFKKTASLTRRPSFSQHNVELEVV